MNEFYLDNSYIALLDTAQTGQEYVYFRLAPAVPTNAAAALSPIGDASSNMNNAASNASPGGQAAGSAVISIPPAQVPGGGSGY